MSEELRTKSVKARKGFETSYREVKGEKKKVRRAPMETIRRNIDYSPTQYSDLESIAKEIGITNQAAVKIAIQQFIDNYYRTKALKEGQKMASNED